MAKIIKPGKTQRLATVWWWLHQTWYCKYCGCEFIPNPDDRVEVTTSEGHVLHAAKMYCPHCGVMVTTVRTYPRH